MFECPICYLQRRKIITLQCDHDVCFFCWQKWSAKEISFYKKEWPTCPICRTPQIPLYRQQKTQYYLFLAFLILVYFYRSKNANPS